MRHDPGLFGPILKMTFRRVRSYENIEVAEGDVLVGRASRVVGVVY